jgi:Ca2+-binding EF-hand superfamily protein
MIILLGILLDGIKQACDVDGNDSRILDFDPDRPLQEQLDESKKLTEATKAEILWNATGQGHTEGVAESVQILHEAYIKHLEEVGPQTAQPQDKSKERAPPLRVPRRQQRSRGKKDKKEKGRVNRISMMILGSDINRTNKLKNAREELEKLNDELLYTNQLINENNAKGGDMIFQIEALQKKLEERGRSITALTERVDDVKKQKKPLDREDSSGMALTEPVDDVKKQKKELDGEDSSGMASSNGGASLEGSLDDYSETERNDSERNGSVPMISIGDKIEIDQQTKVKKRRLRRKSSRSTSRKRKSVMSRVPNLDPVFLRKTFKERIRKLITINNFFQSASDAAMAKEMSADRKSSNSDRQSPLVDLVIPEYAEIHYFDEKREFDENEENVPAASDLDTPDRPLFSPHLGRGRKLPKASSIRHLRVYRPETKVTWKRDDQLHTVRFIPGLSKEHFYSVEEIKMFRFEKFMDDNAEEFEIVEEGEWEEEEVLEDDELSYESFEESYYEDEDEELTIPEEIAEDNLQSGKKERLEEEERLTREEAERLAKEEQEKQAHEEAERLANEEKERLAREVAERLAKEEQEKFAAEEAARHAQAKEKRLAAEAVAEAKAKEEEQARVAAVHEAARKTEEEAEARARAKEESRHKPEVEANAEKEPEQIERAAPFEIPSVPINEDQKENDQVIFRERKAEPLQSAHPVKKHNSTAERSVQSAGVRLDDLIDQIDAVIKRKSPEQDVLSEATKDESSVGASARSLPQPLQDRSPQTDDTKDPESNISEDKEAVGEFAQPALQDVAGTGQHSLLLSLADDQVIELRRTFHAFDTNGSGFVEHDELKANLKLLGHDISESDIEHLLTQVESKDSKLNFEEFIAWNRLLWKDDMEAKFNKIDSDSSGYIDKIQLKAYVVDMEYGFTEEELDDMCYEMDSNGDERIYVDDFINVMVRRHVDCMFVMHQARFH